jgi:hypothetical protein
VATILAWLTPQATAQYSESEVKAAFILNFAQFSKWPPKAFAESDSPLTIAVFGDDSLGSSLEKVCRGQNVGGRKVSIKHTRRLEDLKSCQLVFVSKSESGRLGEILSSFQGANILTVGESDRFTRQGGAIGFVMDGDKVRFEINPGAAQRAGVEVSSRLLKLGKVVSS